MTFLLSRLWLSPLFIGVVFPLSDEGLLSSKSLRREGSGFPRVGVTVTSFITSRERDSFPYISKISPLFCNSFFQLVTAAGSSPFLWVTFFPTRNRTIPSPFLAVRSSCPLAKKRSFPPPLSVPDETTFFSPFRDKVSSDSFREKFLHLFKWLLRGEVECVRKLLFWGCCF